MKDYKLTEKEINGTTHYYATFTDGQGLEQNIEIEQDVFVVIKNSQKNVSSQARQDRRYGLCAFDESIGEINIVDDTAETDELIEQLYYYFDELTDVQQRRVDMYYFKNIKLEDIAANEDSSVPAVHYSLKQAIKKLKNFLNNT